MRTGRVASVFGIRAGTRSFLVSTQPMLRTDARNLLVRALIVVSTVLALSAQLRMLSGLDS